MSSQTENKYSGLLPDRELLNDFELKILPADYREYYKSRKQNLLAIVERFPMLWNFYQSLDSILINEFSDVESVTEESKMFPLALFFNAHAKIRLSIELAFSGCLPEAQSLMRDAIEFVAHAHIMVGDIDLQKIWLGKNEQIEAFKDVFERYKNKGLFKDLPELHRVWGELSETGSHATINALCERFVIVESDKQVSYRVNYTGIEERTWIPSLFTLLLNFSSIEKVIYDDFKSRLQFDERLTKSRQRNEVLREQLRQEIIARYDIKMPEEIHKL